MFELQHVSKNKGRKTATVAYKFLLPNFRGKTSSFRLNTGLVHGPSLNTARRSSFTHTHTDRQTERPTQHTARRRQKERNEAEEKDEAGGGREKKERKKANKQTNRIKEN